MSAHSISRATREDLAADFALGLAEGAELERAERLLATDADFAAAVAGLRQRLSPLDDTAMEIAPPTDMLARIGQAIDSAPSPRTAIPASSEKLWSGLWQSLTFWRNVAIGAAASLLVVTGLARFGDAPPTQPVYVAVLQNDAGQSTAVVNAFADGTVMLVPIQSIAVPQGRIIEVWTLQNRTQGPVSIGRMDQARTLKLDLKSLPKAGVGHLFELTLEPAGGSPTGKPTGPILAKGLAAQRL